MEKTLKSTAINYGIYLGMILVVVTVLSYAIDIELLTKWWLGIILFFVVLAFGIVSTSKAKRLLNGFISFKQAFSSYFIAIAIGILLSTAASILLFNFIDTDAAEVLQEKVIETTSEMMIKFGAPQTEIDKALADMENQSQFSFLNQLKSIAFQLVFYSVIGLIVAISFKKIDPNAE
jgi:predicted cobalt transporter CbtA